MKTLSILFIVFLTCTALAGFQPPQGAAIRLIAKATSNSIRLRWAPNDPIAWQLANRYGYSVERIEIVRGNVILPRPARTVFDGIFRPAPHPEWEKLIDDDQYVALAAQAIFGDDFVVSPGLSFLETVNKSRELESRFSFALLAADLSVSAASLSGLYLEDRDVTRSSRYLYKVYANIPAALYSVDTAFFYIGLDSESSLPNAPVPAIESSDLQVLLSWDTRLYEKTYNSYWIERSDDGARTFHRITNTPVTNTFNDRNQQGIVYRSDTVPENDVRYVYRIRGIDSFGDPGPASDTVSVVCQRSFKWSPSVVRHIEDSTTRLFFDFPTHAENMVRSYGLLRKESVNDTGVEVARLTDPAVREISDPHPASAAYYVVTATDVYGRTTRSLPYLVQKIDTVAPAPPTGLTGRIDSAGHVFLQWNDNTEPDIAGYAVFRANFKEDNFLQRPGPLAPANAYTDTVDISTLTETVYYKVAALDRRFNTSGFSQILVLKKPDTKPPAGATLRRIACDSAGVLLEWIPSASQDVVRHELYRRAEDENDWLLVREIPAEESGYIHVDTDVLRKATYEYTVIAVDDDGLESIPARPLQVSFSPPVPRDPVNDLFYRVDKATKSVTVAWRYTTSTVKSFLVYKSVDGSEFRLYREVHGEQSSIADRYRHGVKSIGYRIVAVFGTGERSACSESLIIRL